MRQYLDIECFLKLTLAVYRVTEIFPAEGDDLKYKIRESANKVLADLICAKNGSQCINDLLGALKEAEGRNWADARNFLVLYREYDKIQEFCAKRNFKQVEFNNGRQKRIYDMLKERKKIQLRDLTPIFPQLSRRTLIRDLEELRDIGVVIKDGHGAGTNYIAT